MKLKNIIVFIAIGCCIIFFIPDITGQCPMCKISAESNMRDGGTAGNGLNTGILYMFVLPYLIVGSLAFLWVRNRKNYDDISDLN